jgi:hypothetical protein
VKLIPLTMGLHAMVDDEDYEELSKYKWFAAKGPRTYYAKRNLLAHEREPGKRGGQISMHKQLTGFKMTDHIDGNGRNNRRGNLRESSSAQNRANQPKYYGSSSRYKGVSWNKKLSKWTASFKPTNARRSKHLGVFESEVEAALAYDAAVRQQNRDFGVYNVPYRGERSALTGQLRPALPVPEISAAAWVWEEATLW